MRTVVSALRFGRQIGSGNFGTVFECDHQIHGKVAVKVMHKNPNESDAEWDQRKNGLLAEGKNLKTAEHNRVVKVHDLTHDMVDDKIYLSLELCTGSLGQLYESGPSPIGVAKKLSYRYSVRLMLCAFKRHYPS